MSKSLNPTQSEKNILKDLRIILGEGVAFSIMVGIGESYLPAFVLALGMGTVASGLISTLPLLAGGFLQIFSHLGVRLIGSHRRWVVMAATIQACAFLPLVYGSWTGTIPGTAVFVMATVYWASGMAIGPVWNVWIEKLVPSSTRIRYFARRSSAAYLSILAGLLAGGIILDRFSTNASPLVGFAVLFSIAASSRFLSATLLKSQSKTDLTPARDHPLAALKMIRKLPGGTGRSLLSYMLVLTVTVTIASPFFTAYMLRRLAFSYKEYMAIIGCALIAKSVALPLLSRIAPGLGLNFILRTAWFGIAAVPALWLVSSAYPYLVALQMLSGAVWAAHEYVTFLMLFELIRGPERGLVLTAYNLGNAIATVSGSLMGGFLFEIIGGGTMGFYAIFSLSSILRLSCFFLLTRVPSEHVPQLPMVFRWIAVRPATGALIRPIVATLKARGKKGPGPAAKTVEDEKPTEGI